MAIISSGCASGSMLSVTDDPVTGKTTRTIYSPCFLSELVDTPDNMMWYVTVVITRINGPGTALLTALGGLDSSDMWSTATAVVHMKNTSKKNAHISLDHFQIKGQSYPTKLSAYDLAPDQLYNTPQIPVTVETYSHEFNMEVHYTKNGVPAVQKFQMKRQTMDEAMSKRP